MAQTNIPSNVMHIAHVIYRSDSACSEKQDWSSAVRNAWQVIRIRRMLQNGIVRFAFNKSQGENGYAEIRVARGTLHPGLIPDDKKPTGRREERINAGQEKRSYASIAFFDLDKQDWRAFNVTRLLYVNVFYEIKPAQTW